LFDVKEKRRKQEKKESCVSVQVVGKK